MKTTLFRGLMVVALLAVAVAAALHWGRRESAPALVTLPEFEGSAHYPRQYRPLQFLSYPHTGLWDAADLPQDAFDELATLSSPMPAAAGAPNWRLVAVGDIMAHADVQVGAALHRADGGETSGGYDWVFDGVAGLMDGADLVLGNLETPVAPSRPRSGFPAFNVDPAMLDALARLGFDVLLTANNHALDQGVEGMAETQAQLEQRGLQHLGTDRPGQPAREFLLVSVGTAPALRLGLVNATFAVHEQPDDLPGLQHVLHYLPPDAQRMRTLARRIEAARAAGADGVLVFLHWGREYHLMPTPDQRALVQDLCLAGADLVLGAGPHVIQPMELLFTRDGALLDAWEPGARQHFAAYSMGNFVSHQRGVAQYGLLLDLLIEQGDTGVFVRRATPQVLRSVVQREELAQDGRVTNHDSFQLRPVPLAEFIESSR